MTTDPGFLTQLSDQPPVFVWQSRLLRVAWGLAASSFVLFVFLGMTRFADYRFEVRETRDRMQREAQRGAFEVERDLRRLEALAGRLSVELNLWQPTGEEPECQKGRALATRDELDAQICELGLLLRRVARHEPDLDLLATAFVPYAFAAERRLVAPAWIKTDDGLRGVEIDAYYDYQEAEYPWFHAPSGGAPTWFEPFFEEITGKLLIAYVAPIQLRQRASGGEGVLVLATALDHLRRTISYLDLGEIGFATIRSGARHVAHPDLNQVLADIETRRGADREDAATEKPAEDPWTFSTDIPSSGWELAVVARPDDVLAQPKRWRRHLVKLLAVALFFLASVAALVLKIHLFDERRLWAFMAVITVLAGVGTLVVWYLAVILPDRPARDDTLITNAYDLESFRENSMKKALQVYQDLPAYVPTGISIESITFDSSIDVKISGYVWQKYVQGLHDDLKRGVVISSRTGKIEEAYREKGKGFELVGWHFAVDTRQNFDFSRYPFGLQNMSFQIKPQDFHGKVVLIPDLDSYLYLNTRSLPGIDPQVFLPGWQIEKSYFSYRPQSTRTSFGSGNGSVHEGLPALYFNVVARRGLAGPFLTYLLPVIVVAFILFAMLMLGSQSKEKLNLLGFSGQRVIGSCGALFLVIIFSHIDLRRQLASQALTYLEMFHVAIYLVLLAVALNALAFTRQEEGLLIYHENLLAKLLFWPVCLITVLALTVIRLY